MLYYNISNVFLEAESSIFLFCCCYRISLPPEEVLEHIKVSASREDKVFTARCTDREVPQGFTWRDWRYQELLRSSIIADLGPSQRTTFQVPHRRCLFSCLHFMLTRVRGSFLRRSSSTDSSSSGRAGASIQETESSEVKASDEQEGEFGQEHKDVEEGWKGAPEEKFHHKSNYDYWSWVGEHDELNFAMKSGLALFGFIEGAIRFPPSFKWRCQASAGSFVNLDVLKGNDPLSYGPIFSASTYPFLGFSLATNKKKAHTATTALTSSSYLCGHPPFMSRRLPYQEAK